MESRGGWIIKTLTTLQQEAYDKFVQLKVGALFMQQGTGKTRTAIELIHSTDSNLAVFFCPYATKRNLLEEIEKWDLQTEYMIVGYESISGSDRIYAEIYEKLNTWQGKIFMVADESIFIKNDEAVRFNRLIKLSKFSEYRLLLNGTPLTHNEWDLYNQMYFLSPKIIDMDRWEFLNTFFKRIRYKKRGQEPGEFYEFSQVNAAYLTDLVAPYVFKADLVFDKKIKESEDETPESDESIEAYLNEKDLLLEKIAEQKDFLPCLSKMQYICFTDPDRCWYIAQRIKGQMIVYCSYIEEIEQIAKHIDCYIITGHTSVNERDQTIAEFKKDDKPLLMTFGVGSFGLNLQFCNKLAFASLTFDYGKVEQAKYRIKRLGQERDIEYIYFTSRLGIYDLILHNIKRKEGLSDLVVKEVMENEDLQRPKRAWSSLWSLGMGL